MRKLILAAAVVAAGSLALFTTQADDASATPIPTISTELVEVASGGGCPANWVGPVPTFLVLPAIDRGNWKDQNGDGLACIRFPAGFCNNRGQGNGAPPCAAWLWKDNTN